MPQIYSPLGCIVSSLLTLLGVVSPAAAHGALDEPPATVEVLDNAIDTTPKLVEIAAKYDVEVGRAEAPPSRYDRAAVRAGNSAYWLRRKGEAAEWARRSQASANVWVSGLKATAQGPAFPRNTQPAAGLERHLRTLQGAPVQAAAEKNSESTAVATSASRGIATSAPLMAAVQPLQDLAVTRLPYLQMGTPIATTLRWRTNLAHAGRVWYGSAPGALTSFVDETASATDHEVRLTGLEPNTRYYYGVGTDFAILAGGHAESFFTTSPPVGRAKNTRIWAFGDAGRGNEGQFATRDGYYGFTGARGTDLFLLLGDNAYNTGQDDEYQAYFFDVYGALLKKTPAWPAIGNHETANSREYDPTLPYYQIFSLPTLAQCGGVPSGTEQWYSFDYGNIHFIALDSMTASRTSDGAMATWLAADVAATKARWIIAYWHHPPYTRGGYNSDAELFEGFEMRQNLLPILEANGVDLVLSGHDHTYERSWLMSGHYGISTTFTEEMKKSAGLGRPAEDGTYIKNVNTTRANQGTIYIVAGSAATLYQAPGPHPALAVGMAELGTAVIDISGNRLTYAFVNETGSVKDSFTIVKPYAAADADADGLPDDYENEYGLNPADGTDAEQDPDGDGNSSREEYTAGTDPRDPGSRLLAHLQTAENGYIVRFATSPGHLYTVERCDHIEGSWTNVAAALPGTGQERSVTDTEPNAIGKRFYRVRIQPQ